MTDPIVDFSDVSQPQQSTSAPRRRGRPRSPDTVERDHRVLTALQNDGPHTKEQLVEKIGLTPSLIYLALWRLKREGRVERTSREGVRYVWQVIA